MDIKALQVKITEFLKKYRYVVLILAIGLAFMLLPSGKAEKSSEKITVQENVQEKISINDELAQILSSIEGAGKVKVMLTVAKGEETVYQTDEEKSVSKDASITKIDTVIITDSGKNENALVRQINPPEYLGAIILCQGADSASVRFAIVDAVSKITGLGSDCISVLKMK